jgi:3-phosphoshikimate 1-carboxyvinyltransferase
MTLDWLDKQGIEIGQDLQDKNKLKEVNPVHPVRIRIKGNQSYKAFDAPIPADFSSATFFLCAAALVGDEVTLLGLDFSDSQPDKTVVDYLREMGADVTINPDSITVKAAALHGVEIDLNRTPDALPAMAVTAAFAEGETRLVNVPQARTKETDRIKCMAEELKKLAVDVQELPDGLIVRGSSLVARRPIQKLRVTDHERRVTKLDGRSDHRIVMALALAGLVLDTECIIDTAEAMNVTFPSFMELMKSLGADMEIVSA